MNINLSTEQAAQIEKLLDDINMRAGLMAKEISQKRAYNAYLEAQVDELQESLGESQAGRAELQRQIDLDIWREQARGAFDHIDKLRVELDAVKDERDYLKEVLGTIVSLAI